jgi:hypothetical protein
MSQLVVTNPQTNCTDFKRFGAFKEFVEQKNVVFNSLAFIINSTRSKKKNNLEVLLAAEGTIGGRNLRGQISNQQQPLLFTNKWTWSNHRTVERNSVVAHSHLTSLHEATGVYTGTR